MNATLFAAATAFFLLFPVPAGATPVAADTWLGGAPFALSVSCEWSESLATRPDTELRRYQDFLGRAFALSVRRVPEEPANNLFRWVQAPEALRGRRVDIILTDSDPTFAGRTLSNVAPYNVVTFPTFTATEFKVVVILRLDRLLFDATRAMRSDALGLTLAAFGSSLYGAAPRYLAATREELRASRPQDESYRERESAISRTALAYLGSMLSDTRLGLTYYDQLSLYREQAFHRQRLRSFMRGEPFAGPFSLTLPAETTYESSRELSAFEQRIFQETLTGALRIVGDFPPPGLWNNLFSWDPRDLRRFAGRSLILNTILLPPGEILRPDPPIPFSPINGATLSAVTMGPPPLQQLLVSFDMRALMLDDHGRARPDRLARTVAFLAGAAYGQIQPELTLPLDELHRRGQITQEPFRARYEVEYRARRAGLTMLQRYTPSPDFAALPSVQQDRFQAVLDQETGVVALLSACLRSP